MRRLRVLFIVTAFVILARCGELKRLPTDPGGGDPPDPNATLTRVQNEILTPSCARIGCHAALGQQAGLVLTSDRSYAALVNVPSTQVASLDRVEPGVPDQSYLVRKLEGTGIVGDRMPQGGPFLSPAQVRLVRDWIRRGAPND